MNQVIKGVLITPNKKGSKPRKYEFETDSYKDYYKLLDCRTFDIQTRKFGKYWLDIYCDDEGLFKEENKPSIVTLDNGEIVEVIVGSVFITGHNEDGETISLTDEEIEEVLSTVSMVTFRKNPQPITVCIARI